MPMSKPDAAAFPMNLRSSNNINNGSFYNIKVHACFTQGISTLFVKSGSKERHQARRVSVHLSPAIRIRGEA